MILSQPMEYGLRRVENLINATLAYDIETIELLKRLNGTTIGLHASPPGWRYYIFFQDGQIRIKSGSSRNAAVTLHGSIIAFAGILTQDSNAMTLAGSGVTVVGDTLILKRLANVFRKLDVDWEAALSDVVGDIPAHFAVTSLRTMARTAKDHRHRVVTGGIEFAQEEWKIVPALPEFENFSRQIRQLSIEVDRLNSRIESLVQKIKT